MVLIQTIKKLLRLSSPIIMGQMGLMLIGAGDVYIASLYSATSVGAIGVSNGIINPVFLLGIGLMMGISPKLSIKRGQGDNSRNQLGTILFYSAIVGIGVSLVTLLVNLLVPHIGLTPEIVPSVLKYNSIVAWSFPFAIIYSGIKEYLQAYEDVILPNVFNLIAVVLNLIINYILVFGFGDYAGIGEIGLAWASFITRFLLLVAIIVYALAKEGKVKITFSFAKEIFHFGIPIAFMFFLEVLAFCMVSILSGKISVLAAATNNIILTIASVSFMIPLSISSACGVKVGHALGEKNIASLRSYTKAGMSLGIIYACIASTLMLTFPFEIMRTLSHDAEVVALGVSLLRIVAIFQFVDALQIIMTGILRGMKYVNIVSFIAFAGYWLVGIPAGVYLTFYTPYGVAGLWIGLAIALTLVSIGLMIFLLKILPKEDSTEGLSI